MLCGMSTEICKKCYVEEEGDVDKEKIRKECGQGEIENIGGEVKLGYNQVRREKIDPEILL